MYAMFATLHVYSYSTNSECHAQHQAAYCRLSRSINLQSLASESPRIFHGMTSQHTESNGDKSKKRSWDLQVTQAIVFESSLNASIV
jgi:hypothetical protein